MSGRFAIMVAVPVLALVAIGLCAGTSFAQTISVDVIQIKASSQGKEYMDPGLAWLAERLKKLHYRSYRRVGGESQSGETGATLRYSLVNGMSLSLELKSCEDETVTMCATVTHGDELVVTTDCKLKKGHTALINVPSGNDKLILAITPTIK